MSISKELMALLACPKCKGDLELADNAKWLLCRSCKLGYEIRDDIPIMLIDEAAPLDDTGRPVKKS